MKLMKKNKRTRIWLIVTIFLSCLMIALGCVANYYQNIISIALGGDRAYKVESDDMIEYYKKSTDSKDEANALAKAVTQEIAQEGIILLKNDLVGKRTALPLASGAKISVFGKNSVNLVYGGTGSGGGDKTYAPKTLYESLIAAGFDCNPQLKAFYEDDKASGAKRGTNDASLDSGTEVENVYSICETPQSLYTGEIVQSYAQYHDAAIVVFSRSAGENYDLDMSGDNDGSKHYLDLNTNERALLEAVNEEFDRVIVVLNTLNIVEANFLDEYGVDACLWIGGPGSTGIMALGEILNGTVTPSGSTTDTWASDFTKDPTWNNFASKMVADGQKFDPIKGGIVTNYTYSDRYYLNDKPQGYYYANYEESIYVGYRYYETRGYEEAQAGNASWYEENVVFPFGYGLSYTSFEWEVVEENVKDVSIKKDGTYTVKVRVTNTGKYKGKDTVQMYAQLPYHKNGLEKPYEVLCGYEKTPMLYPTAENAVNPSDAANGVDKLNSAIVELTFTPYDIASYDYHGISGFTGYVMESGSYSLLINSDAHTCLVNLPFSVENNITYPEDPTTGSTVENRYTDQENEYFDSDLMIKDSLMTRTDFAGSFPGEFEKSDREASQALIDVLADTSHNNPYADEYTMPTGAASSLKLKDMLIYEEETDSYYAPYGGTEDPEIKEKWQQLINSITVDQMLSMVNEGAFKTNAITEIGKPQTLESDGPVGWCNFVSITDTTWDGNNVYPSQVVMSATWNTELIERMGEAVGEEALWGAVNTDGRSYSGWYSPGANIHRSPFGGRNFEYFSEDSYLTGTMAAAEIRGCQSKGVYCYMKHFALNEQETHRGGGCSWVTEQAMREIYLKPFEIAVKEGGTRAMMSSFTRIGTRWAGGDYRLLTEILRDEWGFKGTVISDYNEANTYMNAKQMVYAGGDLNLCSSKAQMWSDLDKNSAADVTVLRMATKNILYTVANSNALGDYIYKMAYWKICLIAGYIIVCCGLIVWGVWLRIGSKKKNNTSKKKGK